MFLPTGDSNRQHRSPNAPPLLCHAIRAGSGTSTDGAMSIALVHTRLFPALNSLIVVSAKLLSELECYPANSSKVCGLAAKSSRKTATMHERRL